MRSEPVSLASRGLATVFLGALEASTYSDRHALPQGIWHQQEAARTLPWILRGRGTADEYDGSWRHLPWFFNLCLSPCVIRHLPCARPLLTQASLTGPARAWGTGMATSLPVSM